jgi:hypothetical protein
MPSRPASFTLYFVEGKDEFSAESKPLVDAVFSGRSLEALEGELNGVLGVRN